MKKRWLLGNMVALAWLTVAATEARGWYTDGPGVKGTVKSVVDEYKGLGFIAYFLGTSVLGTATVVWLLSFDRSLHNRGEDKTLAAPVPPPDPFAGCRDFVTALLKSIQIRPDWKIDLKSFELHSGRFHTCISYYYDTECRVTVIDSQNKHEAFIRFDLNKAEVKAVRALAEKVRTRLAWEAVAEISPPVKKEPEPTESTGKDAAVEPVDMTGEIDSVQKLLDHQIETLMKMNEAVAADKVITVQVTPAEPKVEPDRDSPDKVLGRYTSSVRNDADLIETDVSRHLQKTEDGQVWIDHHRYKYSDWNCPTALAVGDTINILVPWYKFGYRIRYAHVNKLIHSEVDGRWILTEIVASEKDSPEKKWTIIPGTFTGAWLRPGL